ncbi:MAG: hypothetical protein ACOCRL_01975 [Bacillota bacterium]
MSNLQNNDNWSFVSCMDELLPLTLMESNLKYGSFHLVKMSLFLRELSANGYFSKITERKLLDTITNLLIERSWVRVDAKIKGYKEKLIYSDTAEIMIDEIHNSNIHNAYYYSIGLLKYSPQDLSQILMNLGAIHIPNTLGHSISCFFPVIKDILETNHLESGTALFSLIAYLCRYKFGESELDKNLKGNSPVNYITLMKRCSSGEGIINLHHMITFYIMLEWENASFNENNIVPYNILIDWIGDKEIDTKLEMNVQELDSSNKLVETYSSFKEKFSPEKPDISIYTFLSLLDRDSATAIDWIFRIYTNYYTAEWDPHYFTGLYCALKLYLSNKINNKTAARMAIYQAIRYFFEDKN